MLADLIDEIAAMMLHAATDLTHEVELVVGMSHLPTGRPIRSQIRLAGEANLGEQRERAIDRGQVDPGVSLLHQLGDLFGSQVAAGTTQRLPDSAARVGEAVPVLAQIVAQVDPFCHGVMLLPPPIQLRTIRNCDRLVAGARAPEGDLMHAPDGFLNAGTAVATGAISIGAVGAALRQSSEKLKDKQVPLAGITAAFIFAAQMFNFPVAAGTTGHLLGGALAAILLGPTVGALVVTIVVVIQALAFADGGLTALGYNVLNMAIIPAFGGYAVFRFFRRVLPRNAGGVVGATGLAGLVSVVLSAAAFSLEWLFGATAPVSFDTVFAAMVGVHALIGIGEGVISALAVGAVLVARPDLVHGAQDLDRAQLADRRPLGVRVFVIAGALVALFFGAVVSQFAADAPDGLERVAADTGFASSGEASVLSGSVFADYATAGIGNESLSLAVAGVAGTLITLAVGFGLFHAVRDRSSGRSRPDEAIT